VLSENVIEGVPGSFHSSGKGKDASILDAPRSSSMSVASVDFVREDFIELVEKQIKSQRSGKCTSIAEIEELRKEAVKKKFRSKHDSRDTNLLFPPTVIRTFLSKERVESVLGCKCAVCKRFLDDNADTVNSSLVKKLTQTNGDDARRLFSVLLFMGAGFTARHLCGIHFTGLDITPQEAELRVLFSRVQARGLWPDEGDLASRFIAIFKEARSIFEVPTFELGNHDTLTTDTFRSHENLPFLNEKPLGDPARAPLWSFEIHEEFRGKSIPVRPISHLSGCLT
jgi:hypothetical protein